MAEIYTLYVYMIIFAKLQEESVSVNLHKKESH